MERAHDSVVCGAPDPHLLREASIGPTEALTRNESTRSTLLIWSIKQIVACSADLLFLFPPLLSSCSTRQSRTLS